MTKIPELFSRSSTIEGDRAYGLAGIEQMPQFRFHITTDRNAKIAAVIATEIFCNLVHNVQW